MEKSKVLFVDDDKNLLHALQRKMRHKYDFEIAIGGQEALRILMEDGPFAVCIADMRMPGMDGVKLLTEIGRVSPDTVRMMLTGNADQHTAVEAINRGHIFRFFSKPCDDEILEQGINDAIRQYHLITAERDLLEQTLAGSVKVLTDVLAQLNPLIFGRSMRVKSWCDMIARDIGYPQPWELGLAALLAPIGLVSLPPETLARLAMGKVLQPLERDLLKRTPEVGKRLISNIPRLNHIGEIVYLQFRNFDGTGFPTDNSPKGTDIPLGARVLRILNDLAEISTSDMPLAQNFDELKEHSHRYDPELFGQISDLLAIVDDSYDVDIHPKGREQDILLKSLRVHDFLMTDIETVDGHVLLTHGNHVSEVQLQRLRVFQQIHKFHEPIRIRRGGMKPSQNG
ncbi:MULTISPECIES: HD domain-containing phosphohydrolase [Thalassospira]|jgi:response regulator RpfG family c-di-GMP phosphodiesterase|uniref:Response regulator n=1 Tax=Thalassospira xiamenensis TaxID=220697 RepID=A0ABR5Y0L8_9PROT|nr:MULTISPECIES: HD domain-containing phosphohydrolase [Thalassospira]KZD03312.1 response regulator [Thalassospira xiamenensis]KZD07703.1 response regulator [Thalassospira xiamenensis]MAB32899.1 response regulator [Thalassospira sp.]MCD1592882.1 response regulator [Thalassospira xiamenensis]MDM7974838.1 response regulator [Thalassospira xiamenensis]|tara:strand:+ start:2333 stop:3526 length:1194 start_codon:yes stop_codon:yes gene_type:complete